jgi:hypothetical protein
MKNPFRYLNSSPEIIRLTVMMYIRYPLSKLEPKLVQMDLGDAGVYEGLRAERFDDSRNAHRTCRGLIEDKQDCIVVKRQLGCRSPTRRLWNARRTFPPVSRRAQLRKL